MLYYTNEKNEIKGPRHSVTFTFYDSTIWTHCETVYIVHGSCLSL